MGDSNTLVARTGAASLAMLACAELARQRSEEEISNVSSKSNHATTVLSSSSLGSLLPPSLETSIYEVFLQQLMAVIT